MNNIPATLKRLRVASGLTQKQVAKHVKRSEGQISEVENGRANPSYDLLMKLLELYKAAFIILPVAEQSEFTALDKPALLLLAQAGHDLAVAVDGMGDASTSLSVRMRQVERAERRYWELLAALGIKEGGQMEPNIEELAQTPEGFADLCDWRLNDVACGAPTGAPSEAELLSIAAAHGYEEWRIWETPFEHNQA